MAGAGPWLEWGAGKWTSPLLTQLGSEDRGHSASHFALHSSGADSGSGPEVTVPGLCGRPVPL